MSPMDFDSLDDWSDSLIKDAFKRGIREGKRIKHSDCFRCGLLLPCEEGRRIKNEDAMDKIKQ